MTAGAGTRWPAVLAAAACGVAAAMNVGKVPVALPLLRSEFGLSLVQAGWVASLLNTFAVVAALAVGLLAARVGALRMVLVGLAASALASLAALGADGFAALAGTRLLEGAGFMAVTVAGAALISTAAAPRDRRFALGLWACYMPLGAGFAIALAPLLQPLGGWRALWLASALALMAAGLALWRQRAAFAAADASTHRRDTTPITALLARPLPWLLALAFGTWALQHFALIVWLPTYLLERRGFGPAAVAALTCAMLLVNVPGNLIGGALLQRGWPRGALLTGAQLATAIAGWGAFSDALPDGLRYALCLVLSFIGGLIPSSVMASTTALAHTPRQIIALQGLYMQGSQLGQFVGTPLIASVVAASGQWSSAGSVVAGAGLIGAALGLAAWRIEPRAARDRPAGAP